MIGTIVKVGWIGLRRDRVAQAMTFLLPVVFFSIFATVFGGQRGGTPQVTLVVVDQDGSEGSRSLVAALGAEKGLRVLTTRRETGAPFDRVGAEKLVRAGDAPVALVIPPGAGETLGSFAAAGPKLVLLADVSDPVASQIVQGLLQKVAMTASPELVVRRAIEQFSRYAGALTAQQRQAVDAFLPTLRGHAAGAEASLPVPVEIVDVMKTRRGNDLVSFYAAGVAVMFLLFSASAGAGTLLDEVDAGTLERVLTSRLGMTGLLCGKWLYLAGLGALQICVMFTWGALVFALPLFDHLPGFLAMTTATAAAAAGFGLMLATVARSRAQLSGLSTIVILVMSSLGGSMFPRFLMSPAMQKAGLFTFNAWALDGYIKVFWRDAPLANLWPQLAMLVALTLVFLGLARLLARRWEAV